MRIHNTAGFFRSLNFPLIIKSSLNFLIIKKKCMMNISFLKFMGVFKILP